MSHHNEVEQAREAAFKYLERLLFKVFTSAESEALRSLLSVDLSFSQARTLFVLASADGPLQIGDIASLVKLSLAATGRNVDQLVEQGFVERVECSDDRRVRIVSLTPRGQELAVSHIDSKREAARRMLDSLNEAECDRLVEALIPLTD